MARPPSAHPTDGELELLQVLWQTGPAGLGQICTALRLRRPHRHHDRRHHAQGHAR